MKRITVLFENDDCVILNKPAGLPVQGGAGVGASLDDLLAAEWSPRPLLVHRLDRDTSGIILAAKNRAAAARFAALFAGKAGNRVTKRYLAVCAGEPPGDSGLITLSLDVRGAEREAQTAYKRLAGNGDFSLLELELGTGRTHQIRRHLARIGNPVLGDSKYGNFALNRALRGERGLKRLLLHASRLIIPSLVDVAAPPPDYFDPFLALFR
ncbi:MAG: RNA pseudouridine synthase [Spirochaetaceae bacterium]|jgi:23S rRNA pseudouridine955/2504/2580 synthase|nr:RNA pseudouridine synthase [Spirochaetaceae bacterium]